MPALMNFVFGQIAPLMVCILLAFAGPVLADGPRAGIGGNRGYGIFGDPSARTAKDDYRDLWRGLKIGTGNLRKAIGATNSEAAMLLEQIQTNAFFLENKWDAWFKAHNDQKAYAGADEYLVSLRGDNRLLNNLRKEKDTVKILETLRDIALDMQAKADNCRNSGDGLGKEIGVKVHTKAGEKEVGGYEVFYVQKGMLDVKSAHDRFPRQSSPTDEKILCPGGYALWVRKKTFTSAPITMRIGGRGETHLEVDIEVPPE